MKEKILNRIKNATTKQWVKFGIWELIYILFIIWVGNYWWLLLTLFIFDLFVTKFIPYDWWKKYKTTNKTLYTIWSWVDAIVFALVAVYFINLYLFQNYKIPSSSLEKTLLVGDHLYVSKAAYGPRVPNTPLSLPLMMHTIPGTTIKSYLEKPHWDYKRLKGYDKIERNDIVVFNFPAGDTVTTQIQNPDYYTLCHYYGKAKVNGDKRTFGDIVVRPVDHRECYVKRCVAIAGDILQIVDNQVVVNGRAQEKFEGVQQNYFVQTNGTRFNRDFFEKMGISEDDRMVIDNQRLGNELVAMGLDANAPTYHFPMKNEVLEKVKAMPYVTNVVVEPEIYAGDVYPLNGNFGWTRDNYGPIYIPKKGESIELNDSTWKIYMRCIVAYEGNKVKRDEMGNFYINEEKCDHYTFEMDYYWMMGDNRHNSADSRFWGFVPEDHVVGRPVFVWLSLNKDKGLFNGKIRWNRFFKNATR